ncbi:MAG TPA: helix-turn-helix domain-containing protein [Actinomycetota bacterium]|nr:helix-turn-helix domain-containing protein [Actinomycetota bacterium]
MTEQELTRRAKRRLAVLRHAEEVTGNVALTCRYYGISRQVFYKWRQRYDQHGLDGLRDRCASPPRLTLPAGPARIRCRPPSRHATCSIQILDGVLGLRDRGGQVAVA